MTALQNQLGKLNSKEMRIYFDGGRLIRPLLIVEDNKLLLNDTIIKDINEDFLNKIALFLFNV